MAILTLNLLFMHTIIEQYGAATSVLESPASKLLKRLPRDQVVLQFNSKTLPPTFENTWSELIPPNGGKVVTQAGIFTIAMYHQLRCLDEIRVVYAAVHGESVHGRVPNLTAAEICIAYLWQMNQCNADTTLAPATLVDFNGTLAPRATGEEVEHRCNDWTKVRDAVEQNTLH